MRKAVVVVGRHHAGKSKTINKHLKHRLGIGKHVHKFWLNGQKGFVLSQSREEAAKQAGYILSQSRVPQVAPLYLGVLFYPFRRC